MAKVNEKKGMRYPPLNDLIARAHNKYELVIATSTRAREIVDGKDPLIAVTINNPISIATEEIYEDKVLLHNPAFDEEQKAPETTEESPVETVEAQAPVIETPSNETVVEAGEVLPEENTEEVTVAEEDQDAPTQEEEPSDETPQEENSQDLF